MKMVFETRMEIKGVGEGGRLKASGK